MLASLVFIRFDVEGNVELLDNDFQVKVGDLLYICHSIDKRVVPKASAALLISQHMWDGRWLVLHYKLLRAQDCSSICEQ
jgi:hypothetical protein